MATESMSVRQFLRRYNRALIVVLAVFLMVAFLAQDAQCYRYMGGGGPGADALIGTAFGQDVVLSDMQEAANELAILQHTNAIRSLFTNLQTQAIAGGPTPDDAVVRQLYALMMLAQALGDNESALTYHLLRQEAKLNNVRPSSAAVDQIRQWAGIDEQVYFDMAQSQLRLSRGQIDRALENFVAVLSLAQMANPAVAVSPPQVDFILQSTGTRARGQYVDVPIEPFLSRVAEPTDEQLLAHYERYKEQLPDAERPATQRDAGGLGFGYRQPVRVKLEAMLFDSAKVSEQLASRAVRPAELRRFYEQNKERYVKMEVPPGSPPGAQPQRQQLTLEDVQDRVEQDYRRSRAHNTIRDLANKARVRALTPWMTAERAEDGTYVGLPRDRWVAYEQIADEIAKTENPRPQVVLTDWLTRSELSRDPRFSRLFVRRGNRRVTPADFAFNVVGMPGASRAEGLPILAIGQDIDEVLYSVDPQAQSPAPVTRGFFRVVDVQPSMIMPFDQVRDRVRTDWQLAEAVKLATQAGERLAERAKDIGTLAGALEADGDLHWLITPEDQRPTTQPAPATQPADGADAESTAMAASAEPTTQPEATALTSALGAGPTALPPAGSFLRPLPPFAAMQQTDAQDLVSPPVAPAAMPGMDPSSQAARQVPQQLFAALRDHLAAQATQPATQPTISDEALATLAMPLPGMGRSVVRVYSVTELEPVTTEQADATREMVRQAQLNRGLLLTYDTWFSPRMVQTRANFIPAVVN